MNRTWFFRNEFPNYPHQDRLRCLEVSIKVLEADDALAAELFRLLVTFLANEEIPEAPVQLL